MMPAVTLYNYELDEACYRARLMLSILGIDHETITVNMVPRGEEKSPAMLALNPCGALPILKDGDLVLTGTEAIIAYLAKTYDAAGTWLPLDAAKFGSVMQWLVFSSGALQSAVTARKLALFDMSGDFEKIKCEARAAFVIMEDHLTLRQIEGSEWLVGDSPTVADVALVPSFALSRDFGIGHEEFPALRRWLRRFRAIPGFKTMPGIPDYH
jgi:glutathione S-transferase